jgi:hypothetical protein
MVEPQIVVLVVAGSSPVDHPTAFSFSVAPSTRGSMLARLEDFRLLLLANRQSQIYNRFRSVSVAQLDRAADFGSAGWGFESLQARIDSCRLCFVETRRYSPIVGLSSVCSLRGRSSVEFSSVVI